MSSVENCDKAYYDEVYGTFQNAESLLFYANQLAVLSHNSWWNHGPSGFGNKFGSSAAATFGDGWKGFFEKWSQDTSLVQNQVDRKRSYEWSIVGDWTLQKYYPEQLRWDSPRIVPGWFGAENQEGDIAVADISRNGRVDLLVFHIDNPTGENHGYYRIGWDLDNSGVAQSWSPVKTVPGWFGAEDQGAGVALADINRNGTVDLLVFHVDNPAGENHGYYRIGWNLNAAGDPTGGWSPVKAVPGWFGAENQGAGVTLADINGNSSQDLIVYHIDHPAGGNHGYYRIGWNLNAAGDVTGGWSTIKSIPGWFGSENQGGGIAVADLNGDGMAELIVFHIDHPSGGNRGYFRIGWNLNAAGDVTGGWSEVMAVPGWFGSENQGAGFAVSDIHGKGRKDFVVYHIDNPGGENQGYYRIGWNLST